MNVSSPWYWVTTFGTIICLYNVEMHKAAILWPNSCISCVLTCIIFFVPPSFFILHLLHSYLYFDFVSHSSCLSLSLFFFLPWYPVFFYPFFLPCLDHTSLFMYLFVLFVFCLNKTSDPPINRPEPWSMTTSPFCGKPPSVMDDLFISALPRLFSLSACSSLLLKMVTPHSLFTLFGMFLLALPLFCFVSVILIIIHVLLVILFKVNMKST